LKAVINGLKPRHPTDDVGDVEPTGVVIGRVVGFEIEAAGDACCAATAPISVLPLVGQQAEEYPRP
jgi:hypothetical protein